MIYCYTSILDGFDNLRPPAAPANDCVRYICYTNVPNLPRVYPWEYRPIYAGTGNAARDSRIPKILPHLMLPTDAEYSIWHDGNFQLVHDPQTMIESLLAQHDWASHRHPGRHCVYAEGQLLLDEKIGTPDLVRAELERYRTSGHPVSAGLWANGLIVRRHSPAVQALNEEWWKLYLAGAERDQLSFPVARARIGLEVKTIHEDVFNSPWMRFNWHVAWKNKMDNPDYFEQRGRIRERLGRLRELTGCNAGVRFAEY